MSSCYVSTYVVGSGASTNIEKEAKNQYFINGLIPGKQVDTKSLADGKNDYTIISKFIFVDYFLSAITFGIYTPRTVIVKQ